MEKINVFQLRTERVFVCTGETTIYGEARLVYPDGGEMVISNDPEKSVGRTNRDDNAWEQRVIAFVIGFLQAGGHKFLCLTEASEHPIGFHNRIWMIVTSHTK